MAMAAVRFAARRLTGQQPQAILRSAVANGQGVLNRGGSPGYALRRFTFIRGSCCQRTKNQHRGQSRLMAAHQKKEELFDILAEIQRSKDIPYTRRLKDRLVLMRLAKHIQRNSPEWRWYRQEYAVFHFLRWTTAFFGTIYYWEKSGYFDHWKKQVKGADSNSKASVSCVEQNIEE